MPYTTALATIELKLHLNTALLEHQSQIALERVGVDVTDFNRSQLVTAWTKAIQIHLQRQAEDTDYFLARNGNEDAFLDALAIP